MEVKTIQKKKQSISKGKLKKSMKNILCRPDPVSWPETSTDDAAEIQKVLALYKVKIPEYKKPHWSVLKDIPKEDRPKEPIIEKVDGLIFGVTSCSRAITNNDCTAILIEASINPRMLVQHIIDSCGEGNIPVLCVNGLKGACKKYFGIPTSCLGLNNNINVLQDLRKRLKDIAEKYPLFVIKKEVLEVKCDVEKTVKIVENPQPFSYLYRKSNSSRVFIPPSKSNSVSVRKAFVGQDFIGFSENKAKSVLDSKSYMKMIVKKMASNVNRNKKKVD